MALPPGIELERLEDVGEKDLFEGVPTEETDVEFVLNALNWLREWRRTNGALASEAPATFVLRYRNIPGVDIPKNGLQKRRTFREDLPKDIGGIVYYVNKNLTNVYEGPRCQNFDEMVDAIENSVGSTPLITFWPREEREIVWYPNGADAETRHCFSVVAESKAATGPNNDDELLGLVDDFYERYVKFPDGYGTVWENPKAGIVERNAERNIRNSLTIFLYYELGKSPYILDEKRLPGGRADVFIYRKAGGE